jgi:pimeloyl-ACP methyl ester carboxylesterase
VASVFTDHDGVRIHALDNGRDGAGVPALVVPGMGESADEFEWLLDALGDRRVLIVDVRGRGGSDAPEKGYTWTDHYGDLLAAAGAAGLDRPVVIGFSRGSSYAFGAALHAREPVRGLVINDYWARHVGLPPEAVDTLKQQRNRGRTMAERMPHHVIERVVEESEEVPLWDRLSELTCPLLVIRGGRKGSLVSDEVVERYRAAYPAVEVELIPDQGHDLWSRDVPTYLATIGPFLARIDAAATAAD